MSSGFIGLVDCRFLPYYKGRRIELLHDFSYEAKSGVIYTARTGFISDGATIPRIFWRVFNHPFSDCLEAAVLHDLLCSESFELRDCGRVEEGRARRRMADYLFEEMLLDLGINQIRARLMFWGVRWWGAFLHR
jgi:hypothetical protein